MRIRNHTKLILALCAGICVFSQKLPQYRAQVAGIPLKLVIRPSVKTLGLNQKVSLVVSLRDGDGKPAKAAQRIKIRITITEPPGRKTRLSETIDRGEASDTQSYAPPPRAATPYLLKTRPTPSYPTSSPSMSCP